MFDSLLYGLEYTVLTLGASLFWILNQALLFMAALCYGSEAINRRDRSGPPARRVCVAGARPYAADQSTS